VFVIIMSILWKKLFKHTSGKIVKMLLNVLLILIFMSIYTAITYYKYTVECDDLYPKEDIRPHKNYLLKAFYRSLSINIGIALFNWIASFTLLMKIPFIGTALIAWNYLGKMVPGLTHALPLTLIHWIMNLNGNDTSYMCTTCKTTGC
jgi:hypothetical protein